MQKILTKSDKERKNHKNQLIIGILLIGLMVFSTLGFALSRSEDGDEDKKIEYNGIEFVKDNSGYWRFNVQGNEFVTRYNSEEVSDISLFNLLTVQDYYNLPLYFVGDYPEPTYELSQNLNNFVLRFSNACLPDINCSGNYPEKNCSTDNIIIFGEIGDGEKEKILQEDNCIFINANRSNQTKYADAVLFDLLGL